MRETLELPVWKVEFVWCGEGGAFAAGGKAGPVLWGLAGNWSEQSHDPPEGASSVAISPDGKVIAWKRVNAKRYVIRQDHGRFTPVWW